MQTFLQYHYLNKNKLDTQENQENNCIFSVSGIISILSTSVTFMIGIQNQMVIRLPHGQAGQLQILPFFLPIRNLL